MTIMSAWPTMPGPRREGDLSPNHGTGRQNEQRAEHRLPILLWDRSPNILFKVLEPPDMTYSLYILSFHILKGLSRAI